MLSGSCMFRTGKEVVREIIFLIKCNLFLSTAYRIKLGKRGEHLLEGKKQKSNGQKS